MSWSGDEEVITQYIPLLSTPTTELKEASNTLIAVSLFVCVAILLVSGIVAVCVKAIRKRRFKTGTASLSENGYAVYNNEYTPDKLITS